MKFKVTKSASNGWWCKGPITRCDICNLDFPDTFSRPKFMVTGLKTDEFEIYPKDIFWNPICCSEECVNLYILKYA